MQDQLVQPRAKTAESVPFFLRAWWMSQYEAYAETVWQPPTWLTLPVLSLHTDPFCDAGSMDFEL